MRNIFYLLMVAIFVSQCTPETVDNASTGDMGGIKIGGSPSSELDRSQAPKPGPAPKIQMGSYESFTLDNGLECIVVKNDKLPRVSFNYTLEMDPIMEGDKAGMQDMTGQMLRRGTKNRSKNEIDEEVDFIGATLSTYSTGVYASSLTKHSDKILELMADVLLNPTFPEEELEKVKTQTLSGLASAKNDPSSISGNVSNILRYGKAHPYGELTTEETVKNITSEDLKSYYYGNFNPNDGYLIIVGDIDAKVAKAKMQKYFDTWKKGKTTEKTYDMPTAPTETSVAMVDRPGSVQSVITITYPIDLKPTSDDRIAVSVANSILGGSGFGSRLMQNLREDNGFTYGAGSSISYDPLVGVFTASSSVRNEVTDSAIAEFIYEIDRMSTEKVSPEDLQKTKNIMSGSFARSLERPQTVANFALNIARYNLPADYYEKYLERLAAVTAEDVMRVSKKYFNSNNANVLVVGDKDAVAEKIAKYDANKTVDFYDNYGNPAEAPKEISTDIKAEDIINNYIKAIGGEKALKGVKDVETKATLSVQGMSLDNVTTQKAPNKYKSVLSMGGQVFQKQVYNGTTGFASNPQKSGKVEGDELAALAEQSILFGELFYATNGYKLELKGSENIDGNDAYKIVVTSPSGSKSTEFFDVKSGLKVRVVTKEGIINLSDYKKVDGIMYPYASKISAGPQTINVKITDIKLNSGIEDAVFEIK
ncbi:MAG: insulinase family protein [Saprospiraceae bacterium]